MSPRWVTWAFLCVWCQCATIAPPTASLDFIKVSVAGTPAGETPALFLLAMGIGAYTRKDICLDFPARDAHDLGAVLRRQTGRLYRTAAIRVHGRAADAAAVPGGVRDGAPAGRRGGSGPRDCRTTANHWTRGS